MGMRFGLIAARTSVETLSQAAHDVWSDESTTDSVLVDAMEGMGDVLGFDEGWGVYADNAHAVLVELQPVRFAASRDTPKSLEPLLRLSTSVGRIVAIWIQTTGGCAGFQVIEDGTLIREVVYSDGQMTEFGKPQPEEPPGQRDEFYMDEVEAMLHHLGLGDVFESRPIRVFRLREPDALAPALPTKPKATSTKKWWKFW